MNEEATRLAQQRDEPDMDHMATNLKTNPRGFIRSLANGQQWNPEDKPSLVLDAVWLAGGPKMGRREGRAQVRFFKRHSRKSVPRILVSHIGHGHESGVAMGLW